jgi:hypothetical protein
MVSTTLEERIDIFESSEKGEASWRTARRLHWRQRTIQKWRRRGRLLGRAGLHSGMGRPRAGALGSFPVEMSELLRRWRQENPGWGPLTLQTELALHDAFKGQKVPSRPTIARFLKEEGFIAEREPAVALPASQAGRADHAHQVWELDARGYEQIPDVGMVTLINLNDRFTHARLLSYPCWLGQTRVERHATTEDYQACLRLAFMAWGMPETIQFDHDSVFYDNTTRSPFPTRFHLWLIALGISFALIRTHQPRDQGMTERSHQLWYRQVVQGHTFANWSALYAALEQRRTFLNYNLPCRSLANRPPLVAYPDASLAENLYQLDAEAEMIDLDRVFRYLAQGRWFRRISQSGTLSLGRQIYYLGPRWKHQQTEITFDADLQQLQFTNEAGDLIASAPVKGISKESLMGDITDLSLLPVFQMALPFAWEHQRDARLFETVI